MKPLGLSLAANFTSLKTARLSNERTTSMLPIPADTVHFSGPGLHNGDEKSLRTALVKNMKILTAAVPNLEQQQVAQSEILNYIRSGETETDQIIRGWGIVHLMRSSKGSARIPEGFINQVLDIALPIRKPMLMNYEINEALPDSYEGPKFSPKAEERYLLGLIPNSGNVKFLTQALDFALLSGPGKQPIVDTISSQLIQLTKEAESNKDMDLFEYPEPRLYGIFRPTSTSEAVKVVLAGLEAMRAPAPATLIETLEQLSPLRDRLTGESPERLIYQIAQDNSDDELTRFKANLILEKLDDKSTEERAYEAFKLLQMARKQPLSESYAGAIYKKLPEELLRGLIQRAMEFEPGHYPFWQAHTIDQDKYRGPIFKPELEKPFVEGLVKNSGNISFIISVLDYALKAGAVQEPLAELAKRHLTDLVLNAQTYDVYSKPNYKELAKQGPMLTGATPDIYAARALADLADMDSAIPEDLLTRLQQIAEARE